MLASEFFHVLTLISSSVLQWYVAFVLVKLSQVPEKSKSVVLGRNLDFVVKIKTDEALRQYL